jgi:hypothetical protein
MLEGCKRLRGTLTNRKRALTIDDLNTVCTAYRLNLTHDDILFCAQLCIGFFALMHLGELTFPDNHSLWDSHKLSRHSSVVFQPSSIQFFLPGHKADRFFEGNLIVLCDNDLFCSPTALFRAYLKSRDHLFPLSSPLWLKQDGTVPTRSLFIACLHRFFDKDIGRQSMRAGGATSLAEHGVAPHIIQGISCWASSVWQIYIRKHPVLLQAMLRA